MPNAFQCRRQPAEARQHPQGGRGDESKGKDRGDSHNRP